LLPSPSRPSRLSESDDFPVAHERKVLLTIRAVEGIDHVLEIEEGEIGAIGCRFTNGACKAVLGEQRVAEIRCPLL
jgi:hypothetical protein